MEQSLRDRLHANIRDAIVLRDEKGWLFDSRAMTGRGDGLKLIGIAMAELIRPDEFHVLATTGYGGTPICVAMKAHFRASNMVILDSDNGSFYGPPIGPSETVWIVDDLINGGRTYTKLAKAILNRYPRCVIGGIAVLVDYQSPKSDRLREAGVNIRSVVKRPALLRLVEERRACTDPTSMSAA